MNLVKFKNSVIEMHKLIPETRRILKQINTLHMSIDPWVVKLAWVKAFLDSLKRLIHFAAVGFIIQFASNWISKGTLTLHWVAIGALGYSFYTFLSAATREFVQWRGQRFEDKLRFLLQDRQIEKLMSLDIGRLSDPDFQVIKERSESRGLSSINQLWHVQFDILKSSIGIISSVGIILVLDPVLIVLAFLPVIPQTIKTILQDRKKRYRFEDEHILRRKKEEYAGCFENRHMLVQSKLFRFTPYLWKQYDHLRTILLTSSLGLRWFELKSDLVIEVIELVGVTLAMLYLGKGLVTGELNIVKLFFFLGSMGTLQSALNNFSSMGVNLRSYCRDYNYYEQFFGAKPMIDESEAHDFHLTSTPRLILENVSFNYPRRTHELALDNFSLVIEPGEKIAIVGRNGSGKTTLLRLLTKMYLPVEGEVKINQISTSHIKQECWLDHIMYVTQESILPGFPIDEALTGTSAERVDTGRLMYAAELSRSHEFIKNLPQGYQTQYGEDWPGGVEFSTGQKQRLKLTAAFYRLLDSKVYVALFDEPMSHCDYQTKEQFYRVIQKMQDKTVLVIAHDPMYLHHFERVIVIEAGKVIHDLRGKESIEQYQALITETLSVDSIDHDTIVQSKTSEEEDDDWNEEDSDKLL